MHAVILPPLDKNITCGNSLIGTDFSAGELFNEEEERRISPMDFEDRFPHLPDGCFNVIVGNPPYIFTRNQRIDDVQKAYYYKHYEYQNAQLNTFGLFLERSLATLCDGGYLGFIIPNNWLTIDSFASLRKYMLKSGRDIQIVNVLDRVFAEADVDTALVIFQKGKPNTLTVSEMIDGREAWSKQVKASSVRPPAYIIAVGFFKDMEAGALLSRIESVAKPLSSFCTVSTGLKAYQTGKGKAAQTDVEKNGRVFHARNKLNATYGKYLDGVNVSRYILSWSGEFLSYGDWLAEPRRSVPFSGDRLLIRQIPAQPPYLVHGVFTAEPYYNDINSMVVFSPNSQVSLKYLLGLINSRLLSLWFLKRHDKLQRKIFPQ